ncbi:hypothetical protein [Litchfieldia alkalitelluris]|uniref:hypothetical protein n=1 Tax=Litchfieldia alkalitelluris TaxID=304268 RepID=UPI000997C157|nr:hypothetical protein [Litchfieldia alkalitelluris]
MIILADLGNKGLTNDSIEEIINYATKVIEILTQVQNNPGISRAYEARSIAYKNSGDYQRADNEMRMSKAYR